MSKRSVNLLRKIKGGFNFANASVILQKVLRLNAGIKNNGDGSVLQQAPTLDTYGRYEVAYEVDFGGSTPTATDDGLLKTIATLPANCRITRCELICSEVFSNNETRIVDVVATAAAAAVDDVITPTLNVAVSANLASSAAGALGGRHSAIFSGATATSIGDSGAGTILCFINQGTSNGTTALTSGKVVVYLEYVGPSAPSVNDSV